MDIMQAIKDQIEQNSVILYMKLARSAYVRLFCARGASGDGNTISVLLMWTSCPTLKFVKICPSMPTGLPFHSCG